MNDGVDHVRAVMAQAEDVDLPEDLRADADGDQDGEIPPAPPVSGEADPPIVQACAAFPLNDYGNGQRFITHFGQDVMWVPRVGWFTWTGRVWRKDADDIEVRKYSQRISGLIEAEIPWLTLDQRQMDLLAQEDSLRAARRDLDGKANDPDDPDAEAAGQIDKIEAKLRSIDGIKKTLASKRREHRSFARSSGNKARIDATLTEGGIGMAVHIDDLDAAPLDVNTESGVLRFTRVDCREDGGGIVADVQLVPHDRADRFTKMMPVVYDPAAKAPRFDKFLRQIQPDAEMRAFLQRWLGMSMTSILVQKLAFFYGSGANGKSVLVDLIARLMGDYSATAKIESLTGKNKRGGSDATPDLVPLIGARMVRASEPEEGERFQEGLIKELTGGEPILVRALHSDFVEVRPQFKLTISGNHKPEIRGTDDGIWRRVMLVPFDVQIPEAERDPNLGRKLFEQERSGILNWLIEGLLAYLEGGLQEPAAVLNATREFREESDPVGAFLEACCVVSGEPYDTVSARDLGEAFNVWLDDRGEGQWQPRTISLKLKDKSKRWKSPTTGKGFTQRKSSTMSYDGVRFNDVFGKRFREAPRDSQGRVLRARVEDEA
ncbi:DNA primase family protein [Paenirhodobacter sp. CAU 1674]|uniref:DNA primase family protein n=1 Tax=Paenirhodobacter sp. CAU 1674 TaxID=3032596 RepID=UPI0023D9A51F|nr:DNA primase family protein [Paenirhodobacter sp. CAU 1674]MDF2140846.1 phage/plasmid primase, P4 family [Paenirhodobacter sp. CAU 1674]